MFTLRYKKFGAKKAGYTDEKFGPMNLKEWK